MRRALIAAILVLAPMAVAQPGIGTISGGDIVLAPVVIELIVLPDLSQPLRVVDPTLTPKFSARLQLPEAIVAVDAAHNVTLISGTSLNQYDPSLRTLRETKTTEPTVSIALDASGRTYLLGVSARLFIYDGDGKLVRMVMLPDSFYPATASNNIDIAADQCTLFYTDYIHRVRRINVCNDTPLPDFDIAGDYVRATSDGGFAVLQKRKIAFYDATGRLTFTFAVPPSVLGGVPLSYFTFDHTPGLLWLGDHVGAARVRVSDGAVSGSIAGGVQTFAVADESRFLPPPPRRHGVRR